MILQNKPDQLMEWLKLVLTNTKFSRVLPVLSSSLSLEEVGELMSKKAEEIQKQEQNQEGDSEENAFKEEDKFNEISDEVDEEEESDEDMNEETNDFDEILDHMKQPEEAAMNARPTKQVAKLRRLDEADKDWSPSPKKDIKTRGNVGRPKKVLLECKDCRTPDGSMVFDTQKAMKYHMERTHGQKLQKDLFFKCSKCEEQFSNAHSLRRHGLVHQDSGRFPCETCAKVFKRKYALTEHKRIHTGEKPFSCPHCEYRASSSSLLAHHRRRHA